MIASIAEMYSGRFVRSIVSSAIKNQLAILQLSFCIQDSLIQLPNSGTMRSLTRLEVPGQPGLGQMVPIARVVRHILMTDATYRSLGQARCRTISKPLEIQINDTDSYLYDCPYRDLQALAKKSGSHRLN